MQAGGEMLERTRETQNSKPQRHDVVSQPIDPGFAMQRCAKGRVTEPADLLFLQRWVGNRRVQRLLTNRANRLDRRDEHGQQGVRIGKAAAPSPSGIAREDVSALQRQSVPEETTQNFGPTEQAVPAQATSGQNAPNAGSALDGGGNSSLPKLNPGDVIASGGKTYIIFADEVRQGGSCSWVARNPGNIRNGDGVGALAGKQHPCGSSGMFAIFPDEATGFAAISRVLRGYGHITVQKAMEKYAPAGDGSNDPNAYARNVASRMGVTVGTFLDTLNDSQLETFATAVKGVEGWITGKAFARDDASLPQDIRSRL
jgi:hypothetical protein